MDARFAGTLDELAAWQSFWEPLQSSPSSDLAQYRLDLHARWPTARPFVLAVGSGERADAGLLGRLEARHVAYKIGYRKIARVAVRAVVAEPGALVGEMTEETAALLVRALDESLRGAGADLAILRGVPVDSPAFRAARSIPRRPFRDRSSETTLRWTMSLPESLDELQGARSGHRKGHLRYYWNRVRRQCSAESQIVRFTHPRELATFMDHAERVASRAYQRSLGRGFRNDPATRERLAFQAQRGWLRAWIFYLGNEPAAYAIGLRYGDAYHSGDMGYDPEHRSLRLGELLLEHAIEDLCSEGGIRVVDFGFGDDEYKRRLSDASRSEANVHLFAATARGAMLCAATTLISGTNGILKIALRRLGAFHAVRRRARERLGRRAGPSAEPPRSDPR